jgi:hypothetical protein
MEWEIQLPKRFEKLSNSFRKGRNPYEGFIRSYGIQSANVEDLCDADLVFNFAAKTSLEKTKFQLSKVNLMNLYMLLRFFLHRIPHGNIVECGSYQGGSAIFMASVAQKLLPDVRVIGFDTFEGMPPSNHSIDAIFEGEFKNTDFDELNNFVTSKNLANLRFVKGMFQETIKNELNNIGPIALLHIDCDINSSVKYCYASLKESLVEGAYIVFDDPLNSNCLGALEAVEEKLIKEDDLNAEQCFPHLVYRYPSNYDGKNKPLNKS